MDKAERYMMEPHPIPCHTADPTYISRKYLLPLFISTLAIPRSSRISLNSPEVEPNPFSMEQITTTDMKWGM